MKLLALFSRDNLTRAAGRARTVAGGETRLVAWAAGLLLAAMILLAAVAPLVLIMPDWAGAFVSWLPALGFLGGVGLAILAIVRMVKAGRGDGLAAAATGTGIGPDPVLGTGFRPLGQEALQVALGELAEAGLVAPGASLDQAGISASWLAGRAGGLATVCWQGSDQAAAVIRLSGPVPATVLLAPDGRPWPFALPHDGALTPIEPSADVRALAWSTDRDAGMDLIRQLAPMLSLAAQGAAVPFLALRGQALCLAWPGGNLEGAAMLAARAAACLATMTGADAGIGAQAPARS
jgi:hypothetical protein